MKLMVAEQKEIREREMMAEQMSRGRSSNSITGKLVSALLPSLYSRHSSDSGFHSRRGEQGDERMKIGDFGVELFVTDSRPPSLQVSRSASRAESVGSSIFSSDCLEDEPEPSVRVVPGGDVTESYRLGTLLGEGAFSKVFLAESLVEPGGLAAVKVIDKAELCKEEDKMFLVDKEIEIMSQLDHPHIVRLYEVYENEAEVCLVMELAKGGELFDRLLEAGSLGEREAGRVMGQVCSLINAQRSSMAVLGFSLQWLTCTLVELCTGTSSLRTSSTMTIVQARYKIMPPTKFLHSFTALVGC